MADAPAQGGGRPQGQQNPQGGYRGGRGGGGGSSPTDTMRATAEIIEVAEARATAHPQVFEKSEVARARGEAVKNRLGGQATLAGAQKFSSSRAEHDKVTVDGDTANVRLAVRNDFLLRNAHQNHEHARRQHVTAHRTIRSGIMWAAVLMLVAMGLYGLVRPVSDKILAAVDSAGGRGVQHEVQATVRDTVGARWRYRRDSLELVMRSATAERQDTLNYRLEMARIDAGARVASGPAPAVEEPEDPPPAPIPPNRGPCPPGDWECMGTWRPVGQ